MGTGARLSTAGRGARAGDPANPDRIDLPELAARAAPAPCGPSSSLGSSSLAARSPQAMGRIERVWARSRTAWLSSRAPLVPTTSRQPTRSWPASCRVSTDASRSRLQTQSRSGETSGRGGSRAGLLIKYRRAAARDDSRSDRSDDPPAAGPLGNPQLSRPMELSRPTDEAAAPARRPGWSCPAAPSDQLPSHARIYPSLAAVQPGKMLHERIKQEGSTA